MIPPDPRLSSLSRGCSRFELAFPQLWSRLGALFGLGLLGRRLVVAELDRWEVAALKNGQEFVTIERLAFQESGYRRVELLTVAQQEVLGSLVRTFDDAADFFVDDLCHFFRVVTVLAVVVSTKEGV